jgi:transcriptional regulator with XRE-family HTH domain
MSAGTTYAAIIGNVIKQLRGQQSVSQGELAKKMGVTQAAWSKLESGKSNITTTQLAKVADFLNIEANQITRYADDSATDFRAKGMKVTYDNKEADSIGLMLLGAAAIGGIIAAIILSRK